MDGNNHYDEAGSGSSRQPVGRSSTEPPNKNDYHDARHDNNQEKMPVRIAGSATTIRLARAVLCQPQSSALWCLHLYPPETPTCWTSSSAANHNDNNYTSVSLLSVVFALALLGVWRPSRD